MSSEAFVVEAGTGSAHLLLGEVFRTLVSGEDSGGALGFVTMVGPAGRPIPMHKHGEAHDVFFCERGAIQVWFDGESRVLYPGDTASVPPGTLHAYRLLRPYSRSVGPITPGGWERFFAFVGTPYDGPAFPPEDHSPPPFAKFGAAEQEFDTSYDREAAYPDATDGPDDALPDAPTPYVLKAGVGERFVHDGFVIRPLIGAAESGGAFSFDEVEGPRGARLSARHGVLYVLDGTLTVAGLTAGAGDCVWLPEGEHALEVTGAQARWLATHAPALTESRGDPWPHAVFPSPR